MVDYIQMAESQGKSIHRYALGYGVRFAYLLSKYSKDLMLLDFAEEHTKPVADSFFNEMGHFIQLFRLVNANGVNADSDGLGTVDSGYDFESGPALAWFRHNKTGPEGPGGYDVITADISIAGLGVSVRAGDADADDRVDVTVAVTFGAHADSGGSRGKPRETTEIWSKTFESQDKNEVVGHVRRALDIAAKLF